MTRFFKHSRCSNPAERSQGQAQGLKDFNPSILLCRRGLASHINTEIFQYQIGYVVFLISK